MKVAVLLSEYISSLIAFHFMQVAYPKGSSVKGVSENIKLFQTFVLLYLILMVEIYLTIFVDLVFSGILN